MYMDDNEFKTAEALFVATVTMTAAIHNRSYQTNCVPEPAPDILVFFPNETTADRAVAAIPRTARTDYLYLADEMIEGVR
jgi:hypothetical protein